LVAVRAGDPASAFVLERDFRPTHRLSAHFTGPRPMRPRAAFLPIHERVKRLLTIRAAEWRTGRATQEWWPIWGSLMRHIHLADGLRLRFPGRNEDFDQGVEIGMLALLMDMGEREFRRWISIGNLDQARALAKQLGYYVIESSSDGESTELVFRFGQARPQLRLVHSAR
jgi:hypothetical protein